MIKRTSWLCRVLGLGAVGLVALGGTQARANDHFRRAIGLSPTGYVLVAPTGYVVPTTYVVPSSYSVYLPTTYTSLLPTTYTSLLPTSYVATTYESAPIIPTVYTTAAALPTYATASYSVPASYYVPTTYVPSRWVVPTSYGVSTASVDCCDPCAVGDSGVRLMGAPVSSATKGTPARSSPAQGESSAVKLPSNLESTPNNAPESAAGAEPTTKREPASGAGVDSGMPSPEKDLGAAPAPPAPGAVTPIGPEAAAAAGGETGKAAGANSATQPRTKGESKSPAQPQPGGAGGGGAKPPAAKPPVAPGGDLPIEAAPAGEAETRQRSALRPDLSKTSRSVVQPYRRTARNLNWLEGKVVALENGRPEEGVRITLSSKRSGFGDVVVLTDASGRYGVRLPDGDWTVKVTMPSGRVYAVSELVVSEGQINDDLGRPIPSLTITR
jgi:hypothetical protein